MEKAILPTPSVPAPITALLAPGETILATAQPASQAYVTRGLPAIAYGITWSVLGAFWYHGAGGIGKYSAFEGWWKLTPLFSIPFILAGFSFFFHPLTLGGQARRTWYLVTDRRACIVELASRKKPLQVRVIGPDELVAPVDHKRLDGLHNLILTRRAQERPHLTPRFEDGFFGLRQPEPMTAALTLLIRQNLK